MHAANAIFGYPARAKLILVIRSPISFPQAKKVSPIIESLRCAIIPKAVTIPTTSKAQVEITHMEPMNVEIANNWKGFDQWYVLI